MRSVADRKRKRATILVMIVGLLAMLFMLVTAYITVARFDRVTLSMAAQGDAVDEIVTSMNDLLGASIARTEAQGAVVIGANYADIPGFGTSTWLASGDPVRDPNSFTGHDFTNAQPYDYIYPALTSLDDHSATSLRMTDLMVNTWDDAYALSELAAGSGREDVIFNARWTAPDADGDGLPDALFSANALGTELANAVAGTPVRADVTPIDPDPNYIADKKLLRDWQAYDETARYAYASRVISHGGMVQIACPKEASHDWCRTFMQGMFNWVANPKDPLTGLDSTIMDELWLQRADIEPMLRIRGGMLISEAAADRANPQGLPPALEELQQDYDYGYTIGPWYDTSFKQDSFTRFNLDDADDWIAWRAATNIDVNEYFQSGDNNAREGYLPRRILTTQNNSDDLARIQNPIAPTGSQLGLNPGALKFCLHDITSTRDVAGVPYGAFSVNRVFNDSLPLPLPGRTKPRGHEIIEQLASYYYEMLADVRGAPTWGSVEQPGQFGREAVSRRQQAFMLAVNTVAFAAPRRTGAGYEGWFDDIWYTDTADPAGQVTYHGYTPQPFITQVVVHGEGHDPDPNDPNTPSDPNDPNFPDHDLAVAVELFFPHDPGPNTSDWNSKFSSSLFSVNPYALPLDQFGISIHDPNDPLPNRVWFVDTGLAGKRLNGRQFLTIILRDGNNRLDTALPDETHDSTGSLDLIDIDTNVGLEVRLWRWSSLYDPNGGHVIDRMQIDFGVPKSEVDGKKTEDFIAQGYRDTNTMGPGQGLSYYGGAAGDDPNDYARWRMVTGKTRDQFLIGPLADMLVPSYVASLNKPQVAVGQTGSVALPSIFSTPTPLYTMNADPEKIGLHGAWRPASFPTPGFVLFVPRFSHVEVNGTPITLSRVLEKQWTGRNYSATGNNRPPADFGHMPIFDNNHTMGAAQGGFGTTGQVPWGLLAFDYFTTIDPRGFDPNDPNDPNDDIDPYQIPGRININAASWHVLAGLPVIGPASINGGNLPLFSTLPGGFGNSTRAAPAFWSTTSGVLAGIGWNGAPRFPADYTYLGGRLVQGTSDGQWFRLGPSFGQAIAAYRDRLQYTTEGGIPTVMQRADLRNDSDPNASLAYTYRDTTGLYTGCNYGELRGQDDEAKRGFLTLGELVNVPGFDLSNNTELLSGPGSTVLGQGDFMKSVALLALLDTHFLTTRSNTFTIYSTLTDRDRPQASLRSQVTIDRSKLLPRLVDTNNDGDFRDATVIQDLGQPEIIGERRTGYYNARYDD